MANEVITDAGIVTLIGNTDTVIIGGVTYIGDAYNQTPIEKAFSENGIVAAAGGTFLRFRFREGRIVRRLRMLQSLIGTRIRKLPLESSSILYFVILQSILCLR